MRRLFPFFVFVALFAEALSAADQFIIRTTPSHLADLASAFGLTTLQRVPGQNTFLILGPDGVPPDELMAQIRDYEGDDDDDDDDNEVYIERNIIVSLPEPDRGGPRIITNTTPVENSLGNPALVAYHGDALWAEYIRQPAVPLIRVPETHTRYGTGTGIVAVIDTGVDPRHPALERWLVPGYDFLRERAGMPDEILDLSPQLRFILSPYTTAILDTLSEVNPYTTAILDTRTGERLVIPELPPHFGHGTMVAGVVRLVAPTARIMPLKPFGIDGKSTLFNIIRAIYYAHANGATVINMSLSLPNKSGNLHTAVKYVSRRGTVCIASAGNRGLEVMAYPAGYPEVMGVASTSASDRRSPFSNFGDNLVTLAAPGEALVAPYPGGLYAGAWGTSFSAPLVSGTAAVMKQVTPGLTWQDVEAGLKEARSVSGSLGAGRLDVFRAVRKASEF